MRKMTVAVFFVLSMMAVPVSAGVQNGLGLGAGYDQGMNSGALASFNLRLRALSVTPLELETQYLAARGLGVYLNLYLLHTKWVKWSFLNPGVYFPLGTLMLNNAELRRDYDLSFGTGLEVKTWRKIVIYVDARWYFPDPVAAAKEAKRLGEDTGNANQSLGSGVDAAVNFVKDTYLGAAKDWHLTCGVMWFF